MEALTDLKAILHSKRANIYYLEKCRVMQKDGRVLYLTEAKNENQYWNIPIANIFLNHGNYLTYGLAATTLWVLGIPHGFAVMHGKTRREAQVFDVADLVKDTLVLPWSFICSKENADEQEFRQQCLQAFTNHNALEYMFDQVNQAKPTIFYYLANYQQQ